MEKNKIYRILDANLNRAREGLRLIEEIARFVLSDKNLSLLIKKQRGELSRIFKPLAGELLTAREAAEDVGRELYTKSEQARGGMEEVFFANIKRVQEAVRCLEEFSKLIDRKMGLKFKKIRFETYQIEQSVFPQLLKKIKLDFDLYVVTDPRLGHLKTIRKVIKQHVKIIQLRDKDMPKEDYLALAKKIRKIAGLNTVFILNDYWDLVRRVGADGVHLGQEDLLTNDIKKVRRAMGPDKIIGISTHSFEQARRAEKMGADYISFGPIFTTPSKPNTVPVGIRELRRVVNAVKLPVVAIGGINSGNLAKVVQAGCQRIAVIRAAEEVAQLKSQLKKCNQS